MRAKDAAELELIFYFLKTMPCKERSSGSETDIETQTSFAQFPAESTETETSVAQVPTEYTEVFIEST